MFAFLAVYYFFVLAVSSETLEDHKIRHQWEHFKNKHDKFYESLEEEQYRLHVFKHNLGTIWRHNMLHEMGQTTYTMRMNQFGDLTAEEFRNNYLMSGDSIPDWYSNRRVDTFVNISKVPEYINWVQMGAVTSVKNQKGCGSCYAFSAVGALEAQHYMLTKKLTSLSAQNIIDCTYRMKRYSPNKGCGGGRMDSSFKYIIYNRGIDTEDKYPYIERRNLKCKFNKATIGATMSKYLYVPKEDEKQLQIIVAHKGPVSVMVNALGMQFYWGGVYDDPHCGNMLTHAMLVVGYGRLQNLDYWIVKNSWGLHWGQEGYILMARNKGSQCGIARQAVYPIL